MHLSCYNVMLYIKEVTFLQHSWGKGTVSAGQQGSGEEVHLCLGTVRNNWPGASVPLEPKHTPQMNVSCSVMMFSEMFHTCKTVFFGTVCAHVDVNKLWAQEDQ